MFSIVPHRGGFQVLILRNNHPRVKTFQTRQQAENWVAQIEDVIDRGIDAACAAAQTMTFDDALDRYEQETPPWTKSHAATRSLIKTLKNELGGYTLTAITPALLANYRDNRLLHVSASTVRQALSVVRRVLNVALRDWNIALPDGNPVDRLRLPAPAPRRHRQLHPCEEELLLSEARKYGGPIHAIISLALATAMRRNEIANLRWEDVDLSRHILTVSATNPRAVRSVPLSATAESILKQSSLHVDGRVWNVRPAYISKIFSKIVRRARDAYLRVCKNNGIEPAHYFLVDLQFHDLRFEAIARLFARGLSPTQVAAISGHRAPQVLSRFTMLQVEDLATLLR